MICEETAYGFRYGPALVERVCSDDAGSIVVLGVTTGKSRVQVRVTKTGTVRVWKDNIEMRVPETKG